jgi:two-component sensor histidine kinase
MALTAASVSLQSVGLVHERLYKTASSQAVEMNVYLHDLLAEARVAYGHGDAEKFFFIADPNNTPCYVDSDAAMRLGMIISELLTNSVKYAGTEARCSVAVECCGDTLRFEVSDTGPGLGAHATPGMGSRIIQNQLAHLKASMATGTATAGAHFVITLPLPNLFAISASASQSTKD